MRWSVLSAIGVFAHFPAVAVADGSSTLSRQDILATVPEIMISIKCAVLDASLNEDETAAAHLDHARRSLSPFISEFGGCPASEVIDTNKSSWIVTTALLSQSVEFCLGRLVERESVASENAKERARPKPKDYADFAQWVSAVADFTRSERERLSCKERIGQ